MTYAAFRLLPSAIAVGSLSVNVSLPIMLAHVRENELVHVWRSLWTLNIPCPHVACSSATVRLGHYCVAINHLLVALHVVKLQLQQRRSAAL